PALLRPLRSRHSSPIIRTPGANSRACADCATLMSGTSPNVGDITDQNFMESVIEESKRRPVVVDFWAEWCAPCRMIGPVLERLANEHEGEFVLGKLDVDANPQASMAFRIQGIPAVKAFVNGQIANEFVG